MPISTARKAIVAAVLSFLAPLLALVASSADLDWRGVLGSVLAGVIAGLGTYATPNAGTVNGSVPSSTL